MQQDTTKDRRGERLGELLAAAVANPHVSIATRNVIGSAVAAMCNEVGIGVASPEVLPAAFDAAAHDLHPNAVALVREMLLGALDSNEDGELVERIRAGVFGAPRQASRPAGQIPDLAELLSAALQHPDIPADLYNHIGDWINSYGTPQVYEPERIRRALAEMKEGGTK